MGIRPHLLSSPRYLQLTRTWQSRGGGFQGEGVPRGCPGTIGPELRSSSEAQCFGRGHSYTKPFLALEICFEKILVSIRTRFWLGGGEQCVTQQSMIKYANH